MTVPPRDPVDQLIASARELRADERYPEAAAAIGRARARGPSDEQRRYLDAEEARLCYYLGRFASGRELGARVAVGPPDIASARGLVAQSANALALNDGRAALAAVNEALLRLRTLRARATELIDAQIQLTHALAHMGRHGEAVATARGCMPMARDSDDGDVARSEYALGFALFYAGSDEALDRLLTAERSTRARAGALWNWIIFCIAACLRDRGLLDGAASFLSRSSVALRHERAWFAYRTGDLDAALSWLLPAVRGDERPFARTVIGAVRIHRGSTRRDHVVVAAVREFERVGLDHWRWGATWIELASVPDSSDREDRLRVLLDELSARGAANWGFYDPPLTADILRRATPALRRTELAATLLARAEAFSAPRPPREINVLLEALHLLNPEALVALGDVGLTHAEVRTVLRALQTWLEVGEIKRTELATALGYRESTVRTHFAHIRSKLGIEGRRGFEPILSWLVERQLLSPSTASTALRRLAAR